MTSAIATPSAMKPVIAAATPNPTLTVRTLPSISKAATDAELAPANSTILFRAISRSFEVPVICIPKLTTDLPAPVIAVTKT